MMEPTDEEHRLLDELEDRLDGLVTTEGQLERRNLLRFLRARSHSVNNAENMFRKHIQWRIEHDLDNISEWEHPSEYREYWPWEHGGVDVKGGAIVIINIGSWDPTPVTGNIDEFMRYAIKNIESLWQRAMALGKGQAVHQQISVIFDVKGFGLRNLTFIDAMKATLDLVKTFEANYPESLRVGLVINAPYMFGMMWKFMKPLISDYTHSKLRFLGSSSNLKYLRTEIQKHMELDQFPITYGGTFSKTPTITTAAAVAAKEDLLQIQTFTSLYSESVSEIIKER